MQDTTWFKAPILLGHTNLYQYRLLRLRRGCMRFIESAYKTRSEFPPRTQSRHIYL